jgi:hypothetical protein
MLHDGKEVSPTGFDAVRVFNEKGTDRFAIGVDVNDGYKFKVSLGGALGSNTRVTIATGGDAGFGGWTDPSHAIDANGGIRLLGGARYIRLNNGATELVALDLDGTGPTPTLRLYDSQVVIDSGGNQGVGMTGPAYRVDIRPQNNGADGLSFDQVAAGGYNASIIYQGQTPQASNWGLDFLMPSSATGQVMVMALRGDGNVGFGTTGPQDRLHVVAGAGALPPRQSPYSRRMPRRRA